MSQVCNREEAIVASVFHGNVETSVVDHLKECTSCQAAVDMTSLLKTNNFCPDVKDAPGSLPVLIWTVAVFERRRKQRIIHRFGVALGLFVGAAMFLLVTQALSFFGLGIQPARSTVFLSNLIPVAVSLGLLSLLATLVFLGYFGNHTESSEPATKRAAA